MEELTELLEDIEVRKKWQAYCEQQQNYDSVNPEAKAAREELAVSLLKELADLPQR